MNHLGLIHAVLNPDMAGVVVGASSAAQLTQTFEYVRNLEAFDYEDVYKELRS
jgi:hypothetical protein